MVPIFFLLPPPPSPPLHSMKCACSRDQNACVGRGSKVIASAIESAACCVSFSFFFPSSFHLLSGCRQNSAQQPSAET